MNLFSLFSEPILVALGWTLLHALWQGFALVLPAALVLFGLRRRASLLRYRIAVAVLFGQVAASAITFVRYYQPSQPGAFVSSSVVVSNPVQRVWLTALAETPISWQQTMRVWLEAHLGDVVLLWFVGVAVFGVRLVGGWLYVNQLKTSATQPANAALTQTLNQLARQLNLRPVVLLRESARVAVPVVVGVLKPVVLLPIGLVAGLSMAEVEAVLAHELAHVRRNDFVINLLQSVIEVLYFFHPALWWLSARVREERENCCDDLALTLCADGKTLARALANVEAFRLAQQTPTPALAMAFSSPKKQLLHRVRRVLGVSVRPAVSNSSLAGLTLATLLVLGLSAFSVAQVQKAKQPKPARPVAMKKFVVDAATEFGTNNQNQLSYVVWKGQRLSAKSVARLQRELNSSLLGKMNLNNVAQPDRDILLTIIEKTNNLESGMDNLASGLGQIDYSNIVVDAMASVKDIDLAKVSADALASVKDIDLAKVSADALAEVRASIDTNIVVNLSDNDREFEIASKSDVVMRFHNRQIDSLNRLMSQQNRQADALRLQMETLRFQTDQLERQQELLNWKKNKLNDARQQLLDKQRELMDNDDKKLSEAEVEKQVAEMEQKILGAEKSITDLNKSLETQNVKLREARQPLDKLEAEMEKIESQNNRLSDEMNHHSESMNELNEFLNPPASPAAPVYRLRPLRPMRAMRPFKPGPAPRPAMAPKPAPRPAAAPKAR
jgi:bla regulator protein blaR1